MPTMVSYYIDSDRDVKVPTPSMLNHRRVSVHLGDHVWAPTIGGDATLVVTLAANLLRAVCRQGVLAACDYPEVSAVIAGCLRDVAREVDEAARRKNERAEETDRQIDEQAARDAAA